MRRALLSPDAVHELALVLAWTDETFGQAARLRYEALILQAVQDIAFDPNRAGVHERPEIGEGVYTYHLTHSRKRSTRVGIVKHPRHFVAFRILPDGNIEIGRIFHDSMDMS